jgi:hypothetical protein
MARRRVNVDLTLFPFLSVLAGLIAVLMLFMIVTVSTRVLAGEDQAARARQPRREENKTAEPDGIDAENYDRLQVELNRLTELLVQRQSEHEALRGSVEQLKDLLEAKQAELLVPAAGGRRMGVRLGEPTPVKVIPARGHVVTKKPIFIEVNASGYVVHPEQRTYRPVDRQPAQASARKKSAAVADPELAKFLAGVAKKSNEVYLVFLVHPNGASAWRGIAEYVREHHQLDMGWEPFSREWLLIAK